MLHWGVEQAHGPGGTGAQEAARWIVPPWKEGSELDPTLYDHLGGRDAIELAVRGLYARLLEDPGIAPVFDGVDVLRLRSHMTSFLSAALGSGLVHAGRDLGEAHAGLHITDAMFDATVAHLVEVLESLDVAEELITRVLETIAPLRLQVVHGSALV